MILFLVLGSLMYCMIVVCGAYRLGLFRECLAKNRMKNELNERTVFIVQIMIFAVAVYLYLLLAVICYHGDTVYFRDVIEHFMTNEHPFLGYYVNQDIVYPPMFMYIFYCVAKIIGFLGIPVDWNVGSFMLMLKLPGILCVFFIAWILYDLSKTFFKNQQTILVLLLTLLNPAYLFISSLICQIDALYSFFMLLTVVLVLKKNLKLSYFIFAIAILCKFQTIFITPVLLCVTFEEVFLNNFTWKKLWKHVGAAIGAIACLFLSYLPFEMDFRTMTWYQGGLTDNFTTSIQSYGLASQNTYNLWTLLGYNMQSQELMCGPLTCHAWGNIFIVIITFGSVGMFCAKRKDRSVYPMLAAMLVSEVVCFATKMMPRYLYPAVTFLVMAYICKPTVKRFICMLSYIVCFFWMLVSDYMIYPYEQYHNGLIWPRVVSVYFILCNVYLVYTIITEKASSQQVASCADSLCDTEP